MFRKVIRFEEIVSEVMGKHGSKWNSKRFIDANMLREELEIGTANNYKGFYEPTSEEIKETASYLYGDGIEEPCIVAVRENERESWKIMWGEEADMDFLDGPVLFNVRLVKTSCRNWVEPYIFRCHEYIKEAECMLTWTHVDYSYTETYAHKGYYALYKSYALNDSISSETNPLPAKTVTTHEMLELLASDKLSLDGIRSLPTVTEAELEYGYRLFKPNQKTPCFLMVGGKILCNVKNAARLPYLYNAEGYRIDSYVQRKGDDVVIREYEWDTEGGIGVRFKKDYIEDWR